MRWDQTGLLSCCLGALYGKAYHEGPESFACDLLFACSLLMVCSWLLGLISCVLLFLLICSLWFSVSRQGVSYLVRWAGDGRHKLVSKGCVHEVRDSVMGYLNAKAFWKTVIKITRIVAQTGELEILTCEGGGWYALTH